MKRRGCFVVVVVRFKSKSCFPCSCKTISKNKCTIYLEWSKILYYLKWGVALVILCIDISHFESAFWEAAVQTHSSQNAALNHLKTSAKANSQSHRDLREALKKQGSVQAVVFHTLVACPQHINYQGFNKCRLYLLGINS